MAYILQMLLCSLLFIPVCYGRHTKEGDSNISLEKVHLERNIEIVKRSIRQENEVGGNGIKPAVTTTGKNFIQYSDPDPILTHKVDLKLITTPTARAEKPTSSSFNSSDLDLVKDALNSSNEVMNKTVAETNSVDEHGNDFNTDNNTDSGNSTKNSQHSSPSISESAIYPFNNTGAIVKEHSSIQNDSKNDDASDNFATPVIETRKNAHHESTSPDDVANMIGGNNLNTSPQNQANKLNNEIPQLVTEEQVVKPTTAPIPTTTTIRTTVQTMTTRTVVTIAIPTTAKAQIESSTNHSSQSPFQSLNGNQSLNSSNDGSVMSDSTVPSNNSFTENDGLVSNTSGEARSSSPTIIVPTPAAVLVSTTSAVNRSSETGSDLSADTEFQNNTNGDLPEVEPEPEAKPVSEDTSNTTAGHSEISTASITNHKVTTTAKVELVPKHEDNSTGEHSETVTKSVSNHVSKTTAVAIPAPENEDNSTSEHSETVTNSVSNHVSKTTTVAIPAPENEDNSTSGDADISTAPGKNDTTSTTVIPIHTKTTPKEILNATAKQDNATNTTVVSATVTNQTKEQPGGHVTPEPEEQPGGHVTPDPEEQPGGHVTPEPEENVEEKFKDDKNVTDSFDEPVGENTTTSSTSSGIPQTTRTNVKVTEPSPEPSIRPNTTTYFNTTIHPEITHKETQRVSATVEPSAEPENNSSKDPNSIDFTTHSEPYPTEETNTNDSKEKEGEPEPEEEYTPEPETELDTDAFAEPGPDWKLAKALWREAWEFHVYFFGIAFALLGFYCLLALIRLWSMEHMLSKHYFITLQILVMLVCVLRTTYLLIDAYNSEGTFPFGVDYFLYSTAFPCLTALFSLLFYALLLATRVQVISKKVQKLWVLVVIIVLHFIISIATDIAVGLFASASVMILICQAFFILWGLLMFVGYLVIFRKLYKGAINRKKTLMGNHYEHKTVDQSMSKQKYTLGLAVKVTFISAFFGVAIAGFELYGMFGVYGILQSDRKPDPWPWWTYHTIVRSLEVFMCLTIAYVASQPLKYRMKKSMDHNIYHYCLPCSMCCCPDKLDQGETFGSSVSLDYVVTDTDHLSWLKKQRNKYPSSPVPSYPPHTAEKYTDPDATLLVRKVKRSSKPSMLVVEDGFVRIRTEEEILPSNQFELDSNSSHSSDINMRSVVRNTEPVTSVVNLNYTSPNSELENVIGVDFGKYLLQGNVTNSACAKNEESGEETDIDIVVTESENEEDNGESLEDGSGGASNNSVDLFRPLSMIDLATSMESELDRAFNSNCVEEVDLISHNSLPVSVDGSQTHWDGCAFNEHLCDKYMNNTDDCDVTQYSSDSADDQSKSSATRLLRPPVRRCKSDDPRSSSQKVKHFEKNKYFSVSDVESIGKEDELNTHIGSNGELRTEL